MKVFAIVSIMCLAQLKSCESHEHDDSGSPLVVGEKKCADYGSSVGRLEWRIWKENEHFVARCELRDAVPGLNYAIYWTRARAHESEKIVHECDDTRLTYDEDGTLICEYKPRGAGDGNFVCWVKSYNKKTAGSRTRCSSDEIQMNAEHTPPSDWHPTFDSTVLEVLPIRPELKSKYTTEKMRLPITREDIYDNESQQIEESDGLDVNNDQPEDAAAIPTTDLVDDGLVTMTVDPFTTQPLSEDLDMEPETLPPPNLLPSRRYIQLNAGESTSNAGSTESGEVVTLEPPKPDTFRIEGWHLRLVLVACAVAGLLVAGGAIGTTLALKYHNRGRDCCEAECCNPCGGRIDV